MGVDDGTKPTRKFDFHEPEKKQPLFLKILRKLKGFVLGEAALGHKKELPPLTLFESKWPFTKWRNRSDAFSQAVSPSLFFQAGYTTQLSGLGGVAGAGCHL